jgi:hypothetical protein
MISAWDETKDSGVFQAASQRRPNGPKRRLVYGLAAADFAPLCAMALSASMYLRLSRVVQSSVALKASPEI